MGIRDYAVRIFSGLLNKKTQRVAWQQSAVEYTSNFVANIQYKIANEISKTTFNHVQYSVNKNGLDFMKALSGSDIDEVLNWSPKGYRNTTEFWQKVIILLMNRKVVRLIPKYGGKDETTLIDLTIVGDEEYKDSETINLISPFYTSDDTSILDSALSRIAEKLEANRLRGFLKINAILSNNSEKFKKEATDTIKTMQDVANFNGLGVLDSKAEVVELKNNYGVLNPEELSFIKSEILSGYGMSESLLTGTNTQAEYTTFYSNVVIPILNQLERELSYKLLTSYKRVRNDSKKTYERIIVDNQLMKFASIDQLVNFIHENTNAPINTQNEIRVLLGNPPIDGGDVFYTNLNSTKVSAGEDNANEKEDTTIDEINK